ncbi:uncharacterized protein C8Q71DRAFT_861804 [Rhodofomes roseus]|uniref:Uncharacterized protein n=1 Tax=Rhodofomes roseus TaxID=34475 RepID=A0ABQ8K3H5_9APHY|nr:uncharacterized protein C8Q71DRAFT_861804 [Rhodofomes roseus]KAH9831439.1 hypothetical protein C8Q71DRAFT_861804 [Rhodofomes roseus]
MSTQNFVGTQPVDNLPPSAASKIPDSELDKREAQRDPAQEPGANKRAGVASRVPADFDTTGRSGGPHGDPKPTADPVV